MTHGKNYQRKSFGTNVPLTLNKNIYIAKVVSVEDNNNTGRIKVFINGIDQSKTPIASLPYVYPLMSRIVHVMPKVGETVLVFFADAKKEKESQLLSNRFWIGPIITNYENVGNDTQDLVNTNFDSSILTKNVNFDPLQVKSKNKKNTERDIFPIDSENGLNEVNIVGRNNTEISQSDNKIKLRAGKHKKNKPSEKNTKNPVYSILEFIDENTSYSLTAGDEIYLISHKGRFRFKKTITKDDLDEIKKNGQSMLYGELTIQYLKVLTEVFLSHIHQHPSMPPTYSEDSRYRIQDLRKELQNIENLLAKNIKIN